jgi:hypothetical protein
MLTFTSIGGIMFKCTGGVRPLVVFPAKASEYSKDGLTLLPSPEEEPSKSVISWPGEYDFGGLLIRGIGHKEGQQVSYVVEVDGVRCAFLSSPLQEWTDDQRELAGEVDVLTLPSDGVKLVQELVDEFDPRVLLLLPSEKGKVDADILRICGAQGKAPQKELKLKGQLPAEGREVIVLSA